MLLKLNPNHRLYDCPLTEVLHMRSTIEARMAEDRDRRIAQREQEVRLILSTSKAANRPQPKDDWPNTREALKIVDRAFTVFVAVIVGLALGWQLWH